MGFPANKTILREGGQLAYQLIYKTTDPGVSNDAAGDGNAVFEPGITMWINTATWTAWMCVDNTKGAAKWAILGDDTNVSPTGQIVTPTAALLAAGFVPIWSGPGYLEAVLEKVVTITGISTDLPVNIPAKSVVLNAQMNLDSAITPVGNSVKLGLGPVASPAKYGVCTALTKNTKISTCPALALLAAAEDVQVNALQTDGVTIGTGALVTGTARVRITIATYTDIPDAP